MHAAISIKELSLEYTPYTSNLPLPVLQNISLDIGEHEFVSIIGPSGCGKTSLLRVLSGLIGARGVGNVMSGDIRIFGETPEIAKAKRAFGFAFQNPSLLAWRTAAQNIALPHELAGINAPNDIDSLLDLMGLRDFKNALPAELSGGMQQRVNLARALLHRPRILLMDEPFGALDEVTRERLNGELRSLHRKSGATVVFVTHSLREASFLSDRVIMLTQRPSKIACDLKNPVASLREGEIRNSNVYQEFHKLLEAKFLSI